MSIDSLLPKIGITTGTTDAWKSGKSYKSYANAVIRAGGKAVALGPARSGRIEDCDGILVSGGADVHPRHYQRRPGDENLSFEELKEKYHLHFDEPRDDYELPLVEKALEMGIPVLGICRGLQVINIVLGRKLVPDIPSCLKGHTTHSGGKSRHDVEIDPKSRLGKLLPGPVLRVNSYHHEGIMADDIAPGLKPVAVAPDGIIEAFEGIDHPWLVAVQWHPERGKDRNVRKNCLPLFEEFVKLAARNKG